MQKFGAFLDKYLPNENNNFNIAYAYMSAQTIVHILQQCGDDLTRANVMRQAESLRDLELDLLLPGIKVMLRRPIATRSSKPGCKGSMVFAGRALGPILEIDGKTPQTPEPPQ